MIKIALCDDEKVFIDKVCEYLSEMLGGDCEIDAYSSGNELIKCYAERKYDLIILDIEMDGLNGIETAEEIRKTDRNVTIAFLTSYEDFAIQGYNVKAERYILKLQPEYMYREQLRGLINDYNQEHKRFRYSNNNLTFSVLLSDIHFFEVFNRQVIVHTSEQDFTFYGKLSDIEKEYKQDGFIKVGKSFLINASYIKFIDKNDLILKNEQKFTLGRTIKNQVVEEYMNYLSGR